MAGIDQLRSGQTVATSRPQTRTDSSATSRSDSVAESKGGKDAVSLSQESKAIGQLHQSMASEPSFDSAKVAAIKEAIANGSYTVNPEKLAESMMKHEDDLAGL
ncbi:flagellar biosynthesis anti-sigma factor FlgM [Vibrio tapetis]|uniref:Negative regulator of flagellin synthesis n=1 Tax=Vibrio tapetis subsp. tapetis TaxID=1671868 RepID=A0A2N8ZBS7_9VIBR|nr:flagellar biosynthesis anti-sigma factor FlgM [Vibrio tapetis]MDN3682091.1 flagellar biosynthesis anti-sigma factor FlgM [Vibrio tapetis subsp. quintayensis]SON49347.1 putative Negative regulator of flagellin synthesis FlgM (Anti-sigma28 factor) [Vibrio tapetis subsp. tapetis]